MQKAHRHIVFKELKEEYPILAEYDKIAMARAKASGYMAEQLDKALVSKAKEISQDKVLCIELKEKLPQFVSYLKQQISKDRNKGIER